MFRLWGWLLSCWLSLVFAGLQKGVDASLRWHDAGWAGQGVGFEGFFLPGGMGRVLALFLLITGI
jgi:hypothetical protein